MKLIEYLQSQPRGAYARLAEHLNIKYAQLSSIVSGRLSVSPVRCVLIEKYTDGQVTRKDLRPHDWESIWPEIK